jgi:hypothetical protein
MDESEAMDIVDILERKRPSSPEKVMEEEDLLDLDLF